MIRRYYQRIRIFIFSSLNDDVSVFGKPGKRQPVVLLGKGKIIFGDNVQLGYYPSPYFFDGSIHLEARHESAVIRFADNISCNNNLKIVCDKTSISIGSSVLIGTNVNIFDSDFHEISPGNRRSGDHKTGEVIIGENVFIGSNVTILKGVTIGENSIIANGSVVTKSFPGNVIIGGNPAIFISNIEA